MNVTRREGTNSPPLSDRYEAQTAGRNPLFMRQARFRISPNTGLRVQTTPTPLNGQEPEDQGIALSLSILPGLRKLMVTSVAIMEMRM